MAQKLTYTTAMSELESIVQKLQQPDTEIDQLCQLTARAVELLAFCKDKLTKTDEQLAEVLGAIQS